MKDNEAFISVPGAFTQEVPTFFVDRSLVRPTPTKEEVDGQVHVTLLWRDNGRSVVDVPGEPLTFGPRLEVPSSQLA
jgi:hypothetical protein